MKIAFVTFGNFDEHSTLKRATGMASPLIARGCEVYLLLERGKANEEKVALECPDAQIVWHDRGGNALQERRQKQRNLNALAPDVVWICGVGLRNWMTRPDKACLLLADHSELYSHVSSGIIRRSFYSALEWGYCFAFDGHICASRYLFEFYEKRINKIRKNPLLHYSPYANHDEVVQPRENVNSSGVNSYDGKRTILYMGSFWSNYGFWEMLQAVKRLREVRDDFVFVMIGRGPEMASGQAWIESQGLGETILMPGYVDDADLKDYFSIAHMFLCPLRNTIQDCARCPSKLFMYLPFMRPILTCEIGEAKELFGEKGYYFEPGNVESMAQGIKDILDMSPANYLERLPNPEGHSYKARCDRFLDWVKENSMIFERGEL